MENHNSIGQGRRFLLELSSARRDIHKSWYGCFTEFSQPTTVFCARLHLQGGASRPKAHSINGSATQVPFD